MQSTWLCSSCRWREVLADDAQPEANSETYAERLLDDLIAAVPVAVAGYSGTTHKKWERPPAQIS